MSQLLNALGQMITEQRNPNSMNIDRLSALDIVQVIKPRRQTSSDCGGAVPASNCTSGGKNCASL